MRISCEQCGKEFQKRTKKEAEMAVRMHTGRVHGNIKNGGTDAHQDAPTRTKAHRRELTEEQKEHRRQYLRDLRARQKAQRNGTSAHFCPRCGLNLDVLATALAVVNKV